MNAKNAAIIRLAITDAHNTGAITRRLTRLTRSTLSTRDRALYLKAAQRTTDRRTIKAVHALRAATQRLRDHLQGEGRSHR